jgi:hypothetical protein
MPGQLEGITDEWMHKLEVEISQNMDLMIEYDPEHYAGSATLVVPQDRSCPPIRGRQWLSEAGC